MPWLSAPQLGTHGSVSDIRSSIIKNGSETALGAWLARWSLSQELLMMEEATAQSSSSHRSADLSIYSRICPHSMCWSFPVAAPEVTLLPWWLWVRAGPARGDKVAGVGL